MFEPLFNRVNSSTNNFSWGWVEGVAVVLWGLPWKENFYKKDPSIFYHLFSLCSKRMKVRRNKFLFLITFLAMLEKND